MQTKGIINENYKPLITLSLDSPDFSTMQDDVCITSQVDCDVISATTNPVIPTHISDPAIATINIGLFVTPCTPHTSPCTPPCTPHPAPHPAHLSRFIQTLLLVHCLAQN